MPWIELDDDRRCFTISLRFIMFSGRKAASPCFFRFLTIRLGVIVPFGLSLGSIALRARVVKISMVLKDESWGGQPFFGYLDVCYQSVIRGFPNVQS